MSGRRLALIVAAVATTGAVAASALGRPDLSPGQRLAGVELPQEIAYVDDVASNDDFSVFTIHADGARKRLVAAGVGAPAWSPDGRRIAVSEQTILIVKPGAVELTPLKSGGVCDEPAWSPSGRLIACVGPTDDRMSNESDKPGLFIERYPSGQETLLPVKVGWDPSPTWSPDGDRIAYSDARGIVRSLDLKTGATQIIGRGRSPDWSPSGKSIAYATGHVIVAARSDGSRHQTIARSNLTIDQPSWSPDGRRLVFAVFAGNREYGTARGAYGTSRGLRLVNARGGRVRVLTTSGYNPDWRPR